MHITYEAAANYHRDGYLLIKNLFTPAEVEKMLAAVESGNRVASASNKISSKDSSGKVLKLSLWEELGSDIWSAASTCPRIVNNIRILMGEEIAFYHGKVMLKEARTGAASEWHQDYGYWYMGGFLYPHLMSAFIALDPATRPNGCLQVLRGSHKLGRLDHLRVGEQTGADPERLKRAENEFELVHCEMEPGSVLFFHCNLLHGSDDNNSDSHRRSFIMCYNAWKNPQMLGDKIFHRDPCPVGPDDGILNS